MRNMIIGFAVALGLLVAACAPNRHMLKPEEGGTVGGAMLIYLVQTCPDTEIELSQSTISDNAGVVFAAPGYQNEVAENEGKLAQAVFVTNIDPGSYQLVQAMVGTRAQGSSEAFKYSIVDFTDGQAAEVGSGQVASLGYYSLSCSTEGDGYAYTGKFIGASGKKPAEWKAAKAIIERASEGDANATAAAAQRQEHLMPWTDMIAEAFPEPPPPAPPAPAPAPRPAPTPAPPPAAPPTLPFEGIEFETGTANLTDAAAARLGDLATFLKKNAKVRLQITGHTDNTGSAAVNQKLSEKRANAVRDILISKGIKADRLVAVGKGAAEPIADNKTAEGRAKNRRIHLGMLSQ